MVLPNYTFGVRVSPVVGLLPYWELKPDNTLLTNVNCRVTEISVSLVTAVATELILTRATNSASPSYENALPIFPAPTTVAAEKSKTRIATAWSLNPSSKPSGTLLADALKKVLLPAIIGSNVVWTFEEGLELFSGTPQSLVLWNGSLAAGGTLDVNVKFSGT